jgi:hypothetical protein
MVKMYQTTWRNIPIPLMLVVLQDFGFHLHFPNKCMEKHLSLDADFHVI